MTHASKNSKVNIITVLHHAWSFHGNDWQQLCLKCLDVVWANDFDGSLRIHSRHTWYFWVYLWGVTWLGCMSFCTVSDFLQPILKLAFVYVLDKAISSAYFFLSFFLNMEFIRLIGYWIWVPNRGGQSYYRQLFSKCRSLSFKPCSLLGNCCLHSMLCTECHMKFPSSIAAAMSIAWRGV